MGDIAYIVLQREEERDQRDQRRDQREERREISTHGSTHVQTPHTAHTHTAHTTHITVPSIKPIYLGQRRPGIGAEKAVGAAVVARGRRPFELLDRHKQRDREVRKDTKGGTASDGHSRLCRFRGKHFLGGEEVEAVLQRGVGC